MKNKSEGIKVIRCSLKQFQYYNRGTKKKGWTKNKYWPYLWTYNF